MGRVKRKGDSGQAKNFMTRAKALRKLQVSLADFRRLCIFKGIYPREPRNKKKANRGSTAPVTFYYSKDIQYLMHEPILNKFREHKTFAKKLSKALGRGDVSDAKRIADKRPQYKLDHVIKERYPSFMDAIRDVDDALNMLFLFSNMPVTNNVTARVIGQTKKLTNQWMAYVAREKLLRKVFVSIKGVYYSANIKGQEVMWLVPFKFAQNVPTDVDFRVMLTFLEFYTTLVHFILYRLYTDAGLVYPPKINEERFKGIGGLSTYVLEGRREENEGYLAHADDGEDAGENADEEATEVSHDEISKAIAADAEEADAEDEDEDVAAATDAAAEEAEEADQNDLDKFEDHNKNQGDLLAQPSKHGNPVSDLFTEFTFYVGREVPIDVLQFVILSAGGNVISEAALDEQALSGKKEKVDLSGVTHQIVDRPKVAKKVAGRTYVQPQWVFDSINGGKLLNVSDYAPGETLPPHLSPWGDAGNYDPTAKVVVEDEGETIEDEGETNEVEDETNEVEDETAEAEDDEALREQKELEMEAAGVAFSSLPKEAASKKRKHTETTTTEDEEKELKKIMMSNKQRKLYKKMQYGIDKQEERTKTLQNKRAQIEKKKALLAKK